MSNFIQPLVSISCLAYNHELYIRECLEGFIMQQTTFPFEVLIHDDASTDGTARIIREYEEKYPDIIKPIYQTENQYSKGVSVSKTYNFPRAQGQYIAMCEGDDYWTDPLKLQKQVDFLEANSDFVACFTDAIVDNKIENKKYKYNSSYNLVEGKVNDHLIFKYGGGIYPTLTLVFHRTTLKAITFPEGMAGDEAIIFGLANQGDIAYLDCISGVYNRWEGGIFSGIMKNIDKMVTTRINEINGYSLLIKSLKPELQQLLKKKRREKIDFIIENKPIKAIPFIPIYGLRSYLKKIKK